MLYFSSIISGIILGFFWVTLKSIILEFSSIMYLTLFASSMCLLCTKSCKEKRKLTIVRREIKLNKFYLFTSFRC